MPADHISIRCPKTGRDQDANLGQLCFYLGNQHLILGAELKAWLLQIVVTILYHGRTQANRILFNKKLTSHEYDHAPRRKSNQ